MRNQSSTHTFRIYIALLILCFVVAVYMAIYNHLTITIISSLLFVFCIYRIIVVYRYSIRKVIFMFNSIENDDLGFKFHEGQQKYDEELLNMSLNRIRKIFLDAKIKTFEREKFYELIMNSVKTGIIVFNSKGNIYQTNQEVFKLLGLSILTHIDQLKNISEKLVKTLYEIKAGEKRHVSFYNEREEIKLSIIASEITAANDKKLKIIALTDINNELTEKELESWNRLAHVLTHEIMNSLAPITSLSETMIEINDSQNPDLNTGLETIMSTGKGLMSFVDSYRKYAFIPTPNKKTFEVEPFLQRIISLFEQNAKTEIIINITCKETIVYADVDLFSQVITNLLKNALAATSEIENPKIEITLQMDYVENVVINVRNNGDAISEELVEDIFIPFFTTKPNGSGIGLSISRQIMLLHNGSLNLTKNMDGNVCFTLTLPSTQ